MGNFSLWQLIVSFVCIATFNHTFPSTLRLVVVMRSSVCDKDFLFQKLGLNLLFDVVFLLQWAFWQIIFPVLFIKGVYRNSLTYFHVFGICLLWELVIYHMGCCSRYIRLSSLVFLCHLSLFALPLLFAKKMLYRSLLNDLLFTSPLSSEIPIMFTVWRTLS